MAKDPVCGMTVDEKTTTIKADYRGQTYYFCAAGCRTAFLKEPEKYLGGSQERGHGDPAHHH